MFANIFKAKETSAALVLRLGLAAIFIVHGYIKVAVDLALLPNAMSMTGQRVVGWTELLCGLFLLAGLCTRLAAGIVIVLQAAAIVAVTGRYAMEGVRISREGTNYMLVGPEYNLALIAMCLGLLLLGAGALSLDHLIARSRAGQKAEAVLAAPAPEATAPTAVPAPAPVKPADADKPTGSVPVA